MAPVPRTGFILRAAAVITSVLVIFALTGVAGAQEVPGAGNLTNAGSAYAADYHNGTSATRLAGENETLGVSLQPVAGSGRSSRRIPLRRCRRRVALCPPAPAGATFMSSGYPVGRMAQITAIMVSVAGVRV